MTPTWVRFVARRAAAGVVFVLFVSTCAFTLARLAPGDETTGDRLAGVSDDVIAARRAELGLDDPVIVQTGRWVAGLLTLNLGESSSYRRPVRDLVIERGANTAWLATLAFSLAALLGIPAGIFTGAHPRHPLARLITALSLLLVACPPLIGALGLLYLGVLTGVPSTAQGALALPTIALGLPLAAMLERLQSQATREVMEAGGVRAAAARGIPPSRLVWRHAARQALRPVLGVLGIVIGTLFSGSLAVELVASWPGLGRLLLDGVQSGDVTLIAGCVWAGAVCLAVGNLAADLLAALVDPRVAERVS